MVKEDIAGLVVLEVADLQAIGVPNLHWLECGIDGVNFNIYFGLFCLRREMELVRSGPKDADGIETIG